MDSHQKYGAHYLPEVQEPVLGTEERGMKPVVGVVIMVTVTVILAGVIAAVTPIHVGGFVDTTYKNNTAEYPMECNRTSTCPIPTPAKIPILSRDLIRTATNESVTDRFDLPGNGTYHIIVKTYQPETDVVVQVEYQEFQSQDKFGNKAYYPNNSQSLGESDRFSDFETTRFLPPPGKYCAEYGKNIPSACTSADTRNLTLVLVTTKAHQGRITVELWKVA